MSGTAALAAARKRRATPGPTTSPVKEEVKEVAKQVPTNPALLLLQHNHLIQKLQQEVAELKKVFKDSKDSKESNDPKVVVKDESYKAEYLGLLEEMKEMKKVLLKVQTFSMETNLEVMKLKRMAEIADLEPSMNTHTPFTTLAFTQPAISPASIAPASIAEVENILSEE
jgi:hypothetical protein